MWTSSSVADAARALAKVSSTKSANSPRMPTDLAESYNRLSIKREHNPFFFPTICRMSKQALLSLVVLGCVVGTVCSSNHEVPAPRGTLNASSVAGLRAARASILTWAPTLNGSAAQPGCGTPARFSCDATFWNGLLCSNAKIDTSFACTALVQSQTLPDGEFWRSPWEAKARNSSNPDFFSRDQGLALLGSLLQTRNQTLWSRWRAYLSSNKGSMCPGGFFDVRPVQ